MTEALLQAHEVKTALAVSQDMITRAARTALAQPGDRPRIETPHRRRMRALLEGAGWAGAPVLCAFLKGDYSLRYMQCEVVPGADDTARYVTVKDLALSHEAERPVYRRVCLDTVVGARAAFSA